MRDPFFNTMGLGGGEATEPPPHEPLMKFPLYQTFCPVKLPDMKRKSDAMLRAVEQFVDQKLAAAAPRSSSRRAIFVAQSNFRFL
jgi:hypothetical protein